MEKENATAASRSPQKRRAVKSDALDAATGPGQRQQALVPCLATLHTLTMRVLSVS